MPPIKVGDRLLTWASDLDHGTIHQAHKTAALPFIAGHVALMPDAHVGIDENDGVWTVLHSGSRGIGNQLAQKHIRDAKQLMKDLFIHLEDPNLAYFVQSQPQFGHYIRDMLWAQRYAAASREVMNEAALRALFEVVGHGQVQSKINCHHNFSQQEEHHGKKVWITRKGAIKADVDNLGVIPGSMGTGTFIVKGKGNKSSFNSCSHGAGRRMSRSQAKRELTVESLREAMGDRVWNDAKADVLVDEHPEAYKDINTVMADQSDLVEVMHTLRQVFNYKGT